MATHDIKPELIRLPDGIPVTGISHFGRALEDHLIGTHDLLGKWGNASCICLAGLIHFPGLPGVTSNEDPKVLKNHADNPGKAPFTPVERYDQIAAAMSNVQRGMQ